MLNRRMDPKHLDLSHANQLGAAAPRRFKATNLLFLVHSPCHNLRFARYVMIISHSLLDIRLDPLRLQLVS